MDHLWTPWRMKYIQEAQEQEGCVFCLAAESDADEAYFVFARGEHHFLILNRYPYTSGHVMVVPYGHVNQLDALSDAARSEMMALTNLAVVVLEEVYHPEGFNLGMNLGGVAGAGIADHLHLHVVPRWGGDTNFMTAVGQTRVLPESLEDTYLRVKAAWEKHQV